VTASTHRTYWGPDSWTRTKHEYERRERARAHEVKPLWRCVTELILGDDGGRER
jgi:hypothetical protein